MVQNDIYDGYINFGFGVLGHHGVGLTSWCLSGDGWSYPSGAGAGEQGAGEREQVSREQIAGKQGAAEQGASEQEHVSRAQGAGGAGSR